MSARQAIALMPLEIGEFRLAVDALGVLEILGRQEWVAIPTTPPLLPGAVAWRGRALGLLDLGPALGLDPLVVPATRARNLVLTVADDTLAMSVDRVLEVQRVGGDELTPIHAASWVAESGLPCRGEFVMDDEVVAVLDLDGWARRFR
jgi:chemotaxis signal transduction protein